MLAKQFTPRKFLNNKVPARTTTVSRAVTKVTPVRNIIHIRPTSFSQSASVFTQQPAIINTTFTVTPVNKMITQKLSRSFINEREEMNSNSSQSFQRRPRTPRTPRNPGAMTNTSPVLLIRGLSTEKANEAGVRKLFENLQIATDGIKILKDYKGKALGPIFIEFASPEEASQALRNLRTNRDPEEIPIAARPTTTEERAAAMDQAGKQSATVIIKRLPFAASEDDVKAIFSGLNTNAVTVGNGNAVVTFASPQEAAQAVTKSGTEVQKRPVIVEPAFQFDFDYAASRPIKIIRIRGAPATATDDDFKNFFNGLQVTRINITTREGISGRQVPGDVFVEFSSHDELLQALKLDRQSMGERYLQVYRSSARERKNRLEGGNRMMSNRNAPNQDADRMSQVV